MTPRVFVLHLVPVLVDHRDLQFLDQLVQLSTEPLLLSDQTQQLHLWGDLNPKSIFIT